MVDKIFDAIPVSYTGLFADSHMVDAQQFGRSITGISRLGNSICHLLFFGEVQDAAKHQIRLFVLPSKENGLLQEFLAVMNSGAMPLFTPILIQIGKSFVEKTFDAVVKTVLNRKSESLAAIEALHSLAKQHGEFAQQVHAGHMQDKAWLQDTVSMLASQNRTPLRDLPDPVGRSVRLMQIGPSPTSGTIIDEPAAEVLRARDPMTVGDASEFVVEVDGVFKSNGACRLRIIGEDRVVPGKITDPALESAGNIYTTALNEGIKLQVTAKPTLKNGNLHTLFVSDAKRAP
jgi:hypothetical protein